METEGCPSYRLHLNSYVMCIRPLYIFQFFQCRTVFRRHIMTFEAVDRGSEQIQVTENLN